MFSIEVKAGRLLEFRASGATSSEDVDVGRAQLFRYIQAMPGKLVGCGDFRDATIFSQEVAGKILDVFRTDNPRVERSALLVSDSAIFSLQLERLVKQSNNPDRKCFRDPFDLKVFLGPVLTAEERIRLTQFLADR